MFQEVTDIDDLNDSTFVELPCLCSEELHPSGGTFS